jgi:hypothetical protein
MCLMLLSIRRGIIAGFLTLLFEFYAFNFVPRNIAIMATHSLSAQKVDYLINFLLFFIVFYLVLTFGAYLIKKISPKSK